MCMHVLAAGLGLSGSKMLELCLERWGTADTSRKQGERGIDDVLQSSVFF